MNPAWLHNFYDYAAGTVVVCSVLHTFLPPWDFLNDFPKAQKYYKLIVYIIGYIGVNGRSTVYRSISVQNGHQNGNGAPQVAPTPAQPPRDTA